VEPADDQIKLMTFNTHAFGGLDSDTAMTTDSGAVLFLSIVDEEQPDVMCLQEFFRPKHVSLVDSIEARGYQYHYGVHGSNTRSQAILFSRCKMLKGYDMDRKSKFYADIEKNGQTVRVCCVHLDSYQLDEDDLESFENLSHAKADSTTHRLMKKFAETTRQHEREWKEELKPLVEESTVPLIIAGDFNDTPDAPCIAQVLGARHPSECLKDAPLVNLFAKPEELGFKGTLKYQDSWMVFDQIMVSKALVSNDSLHCSVKDARIVHSEFLFQEDPTYHGLKLNRTYVGPKYVGGFSDHLPVVLLLRYSRKSS
jgi:endonuclease/exonuclease/phosphatase family metal-dependent hydrolase